MGLQNRRAVTKGEEEVSRRDWSVAARVLQRREGLCLDAVDAVARLWCRSYAWGKWAKARGVSLDYFLQLCANLQQSQNKKAIL